MTNNPQIDINGNKYWCNEQGQYHREDGPAVEYTNGDKYWYQNGKLHREDGPAYEGINGTKYWFKNDIRHREDGPAIEYADGYKEWYLFGKYFPNEEFYLLKLSELFPKSKPEIIIDQINYDNIEL